MRTFLIAPVLALAACNQPPVVEITSPAASTTVSDHGSIAVNVRVTDENLSNLTLLLDGAPADAGFDLTTLPEDGECDDGCDLTIPWNANEAREGSHTISVVATDQDQAEGTAELTIAFEDVPTATLSGGADQLGVDEVGVAVQIIDRGELTTELAIDGVVVPATVTGDCRFGCQLAYPWDVSALEGEHTIDFIVTDAGDRSATGTQAVRVGALPYATAIEITGESDNIGFGYLEVEIHLADADTGAFLGCTGQSQGMEDVDSSDNRYPIMATFIDATGARLPATALAGRNLAISVTEDDDVGCPNAFALNIDDNVGTSAPVAAADLATIAPMTFGDVVYLELTSGRPY